MGLPSVGELQGYRAMPRSTTRAYSSYCRNAVALLGGMIRAARKERKMTAQNLADRAGISRGLLQRIESGNPRCELGVAFEVAAIVGIRLFDADENTLARQLNQTREMLALLPKSIRKNSRTVRDDF